MRPALIGLLVCSFIAFAIQSQKAPPKSEPSPQVQLPVKHEPAGIVYDKLQTPFGSEQHWVADQILRDIGEILLFAKDATTSISTQLKLETGNDPAGSPTFRVLAEAPPGRAEFAFELKHHLWSSENYSPWATALLTNWRIAGSSSVRPVNEGLAETLLNAETTAIIRQGKRISEELSRHPLDSELHDAAALVLGCFALREASGTFHDTRATFSRMTAHLAIARAIQPTEQEIGKLARIIQLALVGRQKEALESMAGLSPNHAGWANALRLRTTGDWRILQTPEKASFVERMEYFRALRNSGLSAKAVAFFRENPGAFAPDWSRLAMECSLSVQEGHLFAQSSLLGEMRSLALDWEAFAGNSLRREELIEVLNRPATRCVVQTIQGQNQLEVLSGGDLAAFHQRHICHSLSICDKFLRDSWGVPDMAKEFESVVDREFSKLILYPVVKKQMAKPDKLVASEMQAALALWRNHPELLTASVKGNLFLSVRFERGQARPARLSDWFRPAIPFGTAYDLSDRYDNIVARDPAQQKELPFWQEIAETAPFNSAGIRILATAKFGKTYTAEQLTEVNAPIRDFNLHAMLDVARLAKEQPALYSKMLFQVCAQEPDYFILLGNYYLDKRMPDEAAKAYQSAYDQASDRVYVANNSEWLVQYYFDAGRTEEAMKIARDAADAYSSGGLQAMALLLERMGRWSEAESYYKKIQDRYPSHTQELKAFYSRNRERDAAYERMAALESTKLFPNGLEKVSLVDFQAAPSDGTVIKNMTERLRQTPLQPGHVIVAIDGVRVHTQDQYLYVRNLKLEAEMVLIVWNGNQYLEHKVNVPARRFQCDLGDYHGRYAATR